MLAGSVGYLAVVAAQSIAALGALCQGAPVATGPSLSGTLLKHTDTTARDPNFTNESHCPSQRCVKHSPPGFHSRTPLQAPQSHFHTQEGPTAARETVFHHLKHAQTQLSLCLLVWCTFTGLLKRQAPPPLFRKLWNSSTLQSENFLGR